MKETVELRRLLYFGALFFFMFLSLIHLFGIVPMQGDKLTFFLLGITLVLFLLPVIETIHFFNLVQLRPKKEVLKVKRK